MCTMQLSRPDGTAHWFPLHQMRALALAGHGARMEAAAETSAAPPAGSAAQAWLHVARVDDNMATVRARLIRVVAAASDLMQQTIDC